MKYGNCIICNITVTAYNFSITGVWAYFTFNGLMMWLWLIVKPDSHAAIAYGLSFHMNKLNALLNTWHDLPIQHILKRLFYYKELYY